MILALGKSTSSLGHARDHSQLEPELDIKDHLSKEACLHL